MTLRAPSIAVIAFLFALQASAQSNQGPRPLADHHTHLQSVALWRLVNERLPTVALPTDLDELLRAFERNWPAADNKTALANQFSDAWESVRRLPFTPEELRRIATNLAPWLKR